MDGFSVSITNSEMTRIVDQIDKLISNEVWVEHNGKKRLAKLTILEPSKLIRNEDGTMTYNGKMLLEAAIPSDNPASEG